MSLGKLADVAKCSDSHLSDVEHAKRRPTIAMINRICKVLELDSNHLALCFGRVPPKIQASLIQEDPKPILEVLQRMNGNSHANP